MSNVIAHGGGGKEGGSSRQPVEHPDNLHSTARARVLLLMSEGPVHGPIGGSSQFLKSLYLNGTPVQNEDGTDNFPDIAVEYTLGTQDQGYIKGFPASESTTTVGTPLLAGRPWTQQITNSQLSAVVVNIGVQQLIETNQENYDRTGTRVNYRVQLQIGSGAFTDVISASFDGKTTSGYERSHRINLPTGTRWAIRVIRDTPESTSDMLINNTYIGSYVEVIDAKLKYPMSALIGVSISAEHFNGIPTVAYRGGGRIVSVPDNYDPVTRQYVGTWGGAFKTAWTNNPAWVFYDLIVNDRYGLGRRIQRHQIDRYTLYQIGRYCDEFVPDGFGGTEPRFTCNAYIQKASDALRLVTDLASVFRGMSYWAAGLIRVNADIPSDPVYSFTNANVKDGKFVRTSSGLRQRYSVAAVSYNDMTDFGRQKVEFVQDDEAVKRYGIRELQVTAFGCTSRGQAHRVGKYALVTSRVETGGVSFTTGLENMKIQPGDVIRVSDQHRAGRRQGGRVKERVSANSLMVDSSAGVLVGDTLYLDGYSGRVNAVNSNVISVSVVLPSQIAQAVWSVESAQLKPELFRIISIKETSGTNIEYQIDAIEHNPQKYSAVDYDTKLEPYPTTIVPPRVQEAPKNVRLSSYFVIHEGVSSHTLRIEFDKPKGAVKYEVQFRRNSSEWVNVPTSGSNSLEVDNVYAGDYEARVRAINALDIPSLWAYSEQTTIDGLTGDPPRITSLTTESIPWGITLRWTFPVGANTVQQTQIRYSENPSFADSQLLGDYAYPTNVYIHNNLKAGAELWYWARLADKSGVYGPWFPFETEEGVRGVTSLDASEYNELITKEIVESALGQQLISDIESIPDIQEQLGLIGIDLDAIDDKFNATDAEIAALEAQVSELLGTEEWDVDKEYLEGSLVQEGGALYRANKDVPAGTPVSNTEYWSKVGDYASLGDAVSSLLARMTSAEASIDDVTGKVTANSQQITTLASEVQALDGQVQGNATAIDRIETEVTELDGVITSVAERETLLIASLRDSDDGHGLLGDVLNEHDSRAWIRENRVAIATNDESIARVELELGTQIGESRSYINQAFESISNLEESQNTVTLELWSAVGENKTAIINTNQTIASEKQVQSLVNTELSSRLTSAEGGITGSSSALNTLKTRVDTQDGVITSHGSYITALQNDVSTANGEITGNADAISTLNTKVSGIDGKVTSQGTSITQLQSRVGNVESGVSGNASAISTLNTKVTSVDGKVTAQAQSINQIESSVGDVSSTVQDLSRTVATIDGKVSATRTIKVAVNSGGTQYMAGIGIGVDNSTSGIQTQVVVVANRFSVMHTINGSPKAVFSVEGGVAFINDAMIRNASITTAKINNLSVTNGKIANLAVNAAKIDNLAVTTAKLDNAAITTAKIKDLAVDTLRIAGNAVTFMVPSSHGGNVNVTGGGTLVTNTAVVNIPVASELIVNVWGGAVIDRVPAGVRLKLNNVLADDIFLPAGGVGPATSRGGFTRSYVFHIPAGRNTVTVEQRASGAAWTCSLVLNVFVAMR